MIKNKVMDLRGCALLNSSVIEMGLCRPRDKKLPIDYAKRVT